MYSPSSLHEEIDVDPNTSHHHGELVGDHEREESLSTADEIPVASWFTIIKPEPDELVEAGGFVPDSEQTASSTDWPPRIKITCQVCGIGYDSTASLNKHLSMKKDQLHKQYREQYRYQVYHPTPLTEETLDTCEETRAPSTIYMGCYMADMKRRYQCTLCQKKIFDLSSHMKTHFQPKVYQCNICHKVFIKPHTLAYHRHNHQSDAINADKTYKCDVCDKTFSSSSSLAIHYPTHGKKKPYKCKVCRREYKLHSNFTIHMKSHSDEKLYTCHICQRGFICRSGLATHLRTHNNEKPHKCDVCQKRVCIGCKPCNPQEA